MEQPKYKQIIVIPEDERITLNKLSIYEQSNITTKRITMIKNNPKIFVEPDLLLVNINDIEQHKRANIQAEEVLSYAGESFVKLSSTRDIAKLEINQKKSPFSIMRIISEHEEKIYVEIISANDLSAKLMPYLNNYDY